jgi:hypothetical protein
MFKGLVNNKEGWFKKDTSKVSPLPGAYLDLRLVGEVCLEYY